MRFIDDQYKYREYVQKNVFGSANDIMEFCLNASFESSDSPFSYEHLLGGDSKFYTCKHCGNEFTDDAITALSEHEDIVLADDGYICPICDELHETALEAIECCVGNDAIWICPHCGHIHMEDDLDERYATDEILEYWFVSEYFAEKLAQHGEVVFVSAHETTYVWGRTCSGQAISMDGVVQHIVEEFYE